MGRPRDMDDWWPAVKTALIITVSSSTENDQLVGKSNASWTPLRRPSQASTSMSPSGKSVPRIDPCGAIWFIPKQEQQKETGSQRFRKNVLLAKHDFTLPPAPQPEPNMTSSSYPKKLWSSSERMDEQQTFRIWLRLYLTYLGLNKIFKVH